MASGKQADCRRWLLLVDAHRLADVVIGNHFPTQIQRVMHADIQLAVLQLDVAALRLQLDDPLGGLKLAAAQLDVTRANQQPLALQLAAFDADRPGRRCRGGLGFQPHEAAVSRLPGPKRGLPQVHHPVGAAADRLRLDGDALQIQLALAEPSRWSEGIQLNLPHAADPPQRPSIAQAQHTVGLQKDGLRTGVQLAGCEIAVGAHLDGVAAQLHRPQRDGAGVGVLCRLGCDPHPARRASAGPHVLQLARTPGADHHVAALQVGGVQPQAGGVVR